MEDFYQGRLFNYLKDLKTITRIYFILRNTYSFDNYIFMFLYESTHIYYSMKYLKSDCALKR